MAPGVVFPGKTFDSRWIDGWGTVEKIMESTRLDPVTNKPLECTFWASGKGGSNHEMGIEIIRHCVMKTAAAASNFGLIGFLALF